ncbi:MAG: 16S rRNA (cytosine(1402)-N(4))-methyltransferase RsmH [Myxococcota bacterium]
MSTSTIHAPVMSEEALAYLRPRPGGVYCDATLGGAGHAVRVLDASAPDGRLVAIDRDPVALARARERLASYGERVTLLHGDFGDIAALLDGLGVDACDGFLLDLGLSSDQLEDPLRGFSFARAGPLDMRMDPTEGESAAELLRRLDADELADLLASYGEQPAARRVARAIQRAALEGRLATTGDLADLVAAVAPRFGRIHPATRVFMALRIAVNDELGALGRFLDSFVHRLRLGGRVVVIAFHSLEDRAVKRRLRDLARRDREGASEPRVALLTRKPLRPTEAEIARNPRARSAKLRAAERVA